MTLPDKVRKAVGRAKRITWEVRPEILLHPNIPKPMHGVAPRVVLGEKWWRAEREAAYKSTAFHCAACGVWKHEARFRRWLEGHELYDVDYVRGRMVYLETVPLCHCCHNYVHDGRLRSLLEKGQITHAKFVAIIQHGDEVLRQAGLVRASYEERDRAVLSMKLAEWGKWRMVVNGIEYPPKFKTFGQWKTAHS